MAASFPVVASFPVGNVNDLGGAEEAWNAGKV